MSAAKNTSAHSGTNTRPPGQVMCSRSVRQLLWGAAITASLLAFSISRSDAHEEVNGQRTNEKPSTTAITHYSIPEVSLVRQDGKTVTLPQEMNDGRAVVLNFIFTSCGSTCPLMSAMLSQLQQQLGPDMSNVHLMSISIDPEEDTPVRLREYARKFHAGSHWQHYTGSIEASLAVQRAFNVWRGDKMSHSPVTFMRAAPDQPWLRVEGFVTPGELLSDYRNLKSRQSDANRAPELRAAN